MNTNLQQILTDQDALAEQSITSAAKAFETLCYRVVAGETVSAEEVHQTLLADKKTPEDLTAVVQKIEQRIVHRQHVDDADNADARLAEINDKLETFDKKYEKAREKHNAEIEPLHSERDRLASAKQQGIVSRQALIDSVLSVTISEELADLATRRTANARSKSRIRGALTETSASFGTEPRRGLSSQKKNALEGEDKQLDAQNEEIDQRRAELHELALTP